MEFSSVQALNVFSRSRYRTLGSRDRVFESHSGHGCLVFVYVCAFFCVCVQVEALRRADHPSKESYRLSLIKKLRKLSPMLHKSGSNLLSVGATRKEKKYLKCCGRFVLHCRPPD
jgi:hypothetical protein